MFVRRAKIIRALRESRKGEMKAIGNFGAAVAEMSHDRVLVQARR
jgi:hypothetical protein